LENGGREENREREGEFPFETPVPVREALEEAVSSSGSFRHVAGISHRGK